MGESGSKGCGWVRGGKDLVSGGEIHEREWSEVEGGVRVRDGKWKKSWRETRRKDGGMEVVRMTKWRGKWRYNSGGTGGAGGGAQDSRMGGELQEEGAGKGGEVVVVVVEEEVEEAGVHIYVGVPVYIQAAGRTANASSSLYILADSLPSFHSLLFSWFSKFSSLLMALLAIVFMFSSSSFIIIITCFVHLSIATLSLSYTLC